MKILAVADEKAKQYYEHYKPGMLDDIELIIACGDLPKYYLEFLVTMAGCPLLYVHGNHDDSFSENPPEGCICIEDQIYEYQGIRFLGLGGSFRYKPDGIHMYTEKEMRIRILKLWFSLFKKKGFDILVTHAAAYGCGDLDTIPHRGFRCFLKLMEKYRPKYMIHGHVHRSYNYKLPVVSHYHNTQIINAFGFYILEYE